jgi:hypothetical protein
MFSKGPATDATERDQDSESAPLHDETGRQGHGVQPLTQPHAAALKASHHHQSSTGHRSPGLGSGYGSGYTTMVNSPGYPAPEKAWTQHSTVGERSDGPWRAFRGRHYTN